MKPARKPAQEATRTDVRTPASAKRSDASKTSGTGGAPRRPKKPRPPKPPTIIGCAEWIALPELGIARMRAKVDTGARTTAIHATRIRRSSRDGKLWVSFHVPLRDAHPVHCEAPVLEERDVRNTGGVPERRVVILTPLCIAGRIWPIEVTLANRAGMSNTLILGRMAIYRRRILVNPDRTFIAGAPIAAGDTEVAPPAAVEPASSEPAALKPPGTEPFAADPATGPAVETL